MNITVPNWVHDWSRGDWSLLEQVVVVGTALIVFIYGLYNPVVHWDHIAYAAIAWDLIGYDITTVHKLSYEQLKSYAAPLEYEALVGIDFYRSTMYSNVAAFEQQFPYYSTRILYILPLVVAAKLDLNLFGVINFFSAFYHGLGLLVIYFGLRNYIGTIFWLLLPAVFYLFTEELFIVSSSGVDSMAFLWVLFIIVAFLRNSGWLYPLLMTIILIRTDALIFVVLLLFFNVCIYRSELWRSIAIGMACVVIYVLVNRWAGNYGWNTLFYYVFVSEMTETHPLSYVDYSVELKTYISHLLNPNWIPGVLCLCLGLWTVTGFLCVREYGDGSGRMDAESEMLIYKALIVSNTAIIYIFLHYLLFPLILTRFFYAHYLVTYIGFACVCTLLWRDRLHRGPEVLTYN